MDIGFIWTWVDTLSILYLGSEHHSWVVSNVSFKFAHIKDGMRENMRHHTLLKTACVRFMSLSVIRALIERKGPNEVRNSVAECRNIVIEIAPLCKVVIPMLIHWGNHSTQRHDSDSDWPALSHRTVSERPLVKHNVKEHLISLLCNKVTSEKSMSYRSGNVAATSISSEAVGLQTNIFMNSANRSAFAWNVFNA